MSSRTTPPFRADHVGSFLRPRRLIEAREKHAAGALSDAALREVEVTALEDATDRLVEELGLLHLAQDAHFHLTQHGPPPHRCAGSS